MIRRMNNGKIKNIAGGNPESLEVRAVEAPGNIPKFVLVNKDTGNWVGLFGVEYLPGTYDVTENSAIDIFTVLRSATSVVARKPNFRRSVYSLSLKGAAGVFREIGTNSGVLHSMPRLILPNGNAVVPSKEFYQNVSYLGSFNTPILSDY